MKQFLKKINTIMLCLTLLFCVVGCAGKEDTNTDTAVSTVVPSTEQLEQISKQLIDANVFEGEMAEVNKKMVKEAYKLEQGEVLVSYMSTASKADEITIIQTENVSSVADLANAYISDRIKTFESYAPEECEKLKQSIQLTYGTENGVCIVCVSSKKEEAKKIVDSCIQ